MERATKALLEKGISREVTTLPESTRTAVDAAAAVGCSVAQIAKSLVFKGAESARPVMVVASGANRVDVAKVGALLGERVAKPDADYVREKTGYAIGGVAPVGHREVMPGAARRRSISARSYLGGSRKPE